jgi:hypothetical protein
MPQDVLTDLFDSNVCAAAKVLPLSEFLRSDDDSVRRFVCNQQSRTLAGDDRATKPLDPGALVKNALNNLEQFSFVGFVEDMDGSVGRLSQLLRISFFERLRHLNRTVARPAMREIDPYDVRLIADLNSADLEVYSLTRARHSAAQSI